MCSWAPQAISAKVKERLAVLVAEDRKLAEEKAMLALQVAVYPLDGLDLEATSTDLKELFPGIEVHDDLPSRSLVVRAIGKTQLAVKARVNKLKKQEQNLKLLKQIWLLHKKIFQLQKELTYLV